MEYYAEAKKEIDLLLLKRYNPQEIVTLKRSTVYRTV